MNKCCEENWDIAPFGSRHAWVAGVHGEPTGACLHCGKLYEDYSRQMIDKIIERQQADFEANQVDDAELEVTPEELEQIQDTIKKNEKMKEEA